VCSFENKVPGGFLDFFKKATNNLSGEADSSPWAGRAVLAAGETRTLASNTRLRPTSVICTRLDAPIVLAHGLFGFRRIGLGRLTLSSYYRGIPEFLQAAGNRVFLSHVPPISGVKVRARVLGREIDQAFPGESVHVIAHSMGGLDARQLLADPAWSQRILSLTTIGTPHLGSSIADLARLRVGRVYRVLHKLGVEHRGFHDVSRRVARAVSRSTFKPDGIPCFSVAGVPAMADVCWPLKPFYDILLDLEGSNDGLVSAESAHAFGTPLPDWPIDHFRQMNWMSPRRGVSAEPEILRLYASVLANLEAHGFSTREPLPDLAKWQKRWERRRLSNEARGFRLQRLWPTFNVDRPVKKHGHGHVSKDVGSGPAAIEEPVDRQQHGDLIRR
jgi:triacylglycerol lipase